ncbi:MAG TPA: hypothetical protein VFF98_00005, partial [Novosphingobium sp.]|nr:hypothetical protein [Novosphingobium sp.]
WVYRQNWQRETDTAAPAGKGERRLSVTIMATAGDRARVSLTEMGAAMPLPASHPPVASAPAQIIALRALPLVILRPIRIGSSA